MDAQLHLLPEADDDPQSLLAPRETDWRIDDSTRAVGRRGIQRARAALQSAARHRHDSDDDRHASAA
jgi:hypothetical protein